jgi:hypothetical protein
MSRFLTPLRAELLDEQEAGRELWMLLEPLVYESDLLGRIEVPAGYVCDGESVPRAIAGLTGPPCRKAGTVHDLLYQLHPFGDTEAERQRADVVYHEAMLVCGLDPVYADQRLAAVAAYGKPHWESGPRRRCVLPP